MAISISSITQTSFTVNWTSHGSNVQYYSIEIWQSGSLVRSARDIISSARSYNIPSLSVDTLYEVKLFSRDASNTTVQIEYAYPRTDPYPPATPTSFRVYDSTSTTLSLAWNTVSGADKYVVEVYHSATNALVWDKRDITGGSVYVSGLSNGITYDLKLYAANAGGNSSPTWIYGVIVGKVRPLNWSWSTTKAKGYAYNLTNGQVTNLITYNEIIGFQDRINEFRAYKSLSAYSFSTRTKGQTYTSTISNQLKAAINSMSPPVSTGSFTNLIDEFNRLRDSLNSIQ